MNKMSGLASFMNATLKSKANDPTDKIQKYLDDLKSGKISVSSPIGKGLLGKSVGEVAEITVPNGVLKFEILAISRD